MINIYRLLVSSTLGILIFLYNILPVHAQKMNFEETPEQFAQRKAITEDTMKAWILLRENNFADAALLFRSVTDRDNLHGEAWAGLAESLVASGQDKEARKAYETLYFGNNGNPINAYAREIPVATKAIEFFIKSRRLSSALSVYQYLIRHQFRGQLSIGHEHPEFPTYQYSRPKSGDILAMAQLSKAFYLLKQDKPIDALGCADKAVNLAPKLPITHYYKGFFLHKNGHIAEGNAAYQAAIRLGKEDSSLKEMATQKIIPIP